jgi:hypothetical protein
MYLEAQAIGIFLRAKKELNIKKTPRPESASELYRPSEELNIFILILGLRL